MSDNDEYIDELIQKPKESRHRKILDELAKFDDSPIDLDEGETFSLPSSPSWMGGATKIDDTSVEYSRGKKKKKKKAYESEEEESADEWTAHLMEIATTTITKNRGRKHFILDENGEIIERKKKKKKKKENGEPTNFEKVFAPEMSLYTSLLRDQSAFVNSLQKQYNDAVSVKGSNRGISKTVTDLVANITSARSAEMQLIDKTVNLKKLSYELAAKERKEMGVSGDGENMSDFASAYLRQMINNRNVLTAPQDYDIEDMDSDAMNATITEIGGEILNREDDVDRYLKYENENIQIYAYVNPEDLTDYEFRAFNVDDEEILDYPLPLKSKLSVNRSTGTATDEYGRKYFIRWV